MPTKKTVLNWEYCECGCHGSELRIAGLYFWSLYDLYEEVIHLNSGHKWGQHLGTFKTAEKRNQFIIEMYLKPRVGELQEDLKRLKKLCK